ncbi:hypothetical protein ACS0TY_035206 [Phlomoides rotata]
MRGIENLKTIKRILRLFELSPGLKVNYSKSRIYGYNYSAEELEEAASILGCNLERVIYLIWA